MQCLQVLLHPLGFCFLIEVAKQHCSRLHVTFKYLLVVPPLLNVISNKEVSYCRKAYLCHFLTVNDILFREISIPLIADFFFVRVLIVE